MLQHSEEQRHELQVLHGPDAVIQQPVCVGGGGGGAQHGRMHQT
jgi:hypothetical protein